MRGVDRVDAAVERVRLGADVRLAAGRVFHDGQVSGPRMGAAICGNGSGVSAFAATTYFGNIPINAAALSGARVLRSLLK